MEKRFINLEELSQYLGIAKGTLYIWVCHKKIPYFKIGRLVKFSLPEIEAWAHKQHVETM